MTKTKQTLKLLKAISDETRLSIILFLVSGEKCVCEIYQHLKLSQNLVSHHLGILRQSKIIVNRKDGKWVHYSLNNENIKTIQKSLEKITKTKKISSKC